MIKISGQIKKQELSDELINAIIVESGSNENGNYIKFGDGTMVCYYSRNDGDVTFENSQDLWARSDKFYWIYPQPFIETAQFFVTGGGLDSSLLVIGSSNSKTRGEYRWGRMIPFTTSPYTRATGVVSFFAIGSWK